MSLTFKRVRYPGDPDIWVAQVAGATVWSYEIEPDGTSWSVNVLRPNQQLMGPLHAKVFGVLADDMRFSAQRFRTLSEAKHACELHLAQEVQR